MTTDLPLTHGWTLTDLHRLTRTAVNMAGQRATDYADRYDAARGGILIALYTAPTPPDRRTLLAAGAQAVHDDITQALHLYGYRHRDAYNGYASAPRYRTYWADIAAVTPSPEDRIVDRLAIDQILPRLTRTEAEAIAALAAADDYTAAADLLGISYDAFKRRIHCARRRILTHWHGTETPSRPWGTDQRRSSTRRRSATEILTIRRRRGHRQPAATEGAPR